MSDIDTLLRRYKRHRREVPLKTGFFGVAEDILMFRRMLTPWLIRGGFALALIFAVASIGAVVARIVTGTPTPPTPAPTMKFGVRGAPPPAFPSLPTWLTGPTGEVLGILLTIVLIRVICEGMIVIFQINETLTDMRKEAAKGSGDEA